MRREWVCLVVGDDGVVLGGWLVLASAAVEGSWEVWLVVCRQEQRVKGWLW